MRLRCELRILRRDTHQSPFAQSLTLDSHVQGNLQVGICGRPNRSIRDNAQHNYIFCAYRHMSRYLSLKNLYGGRSLECSLFEVIPLSWFSTCKPQTSGIRNVPYAARIPSTELCPRKGNDCRLSYRQESIQVILREKTTGTQRRSRAAA